MFHSEKEENRKKIVQSILENLDNEKTYFHGRHLKIFNLLNKLVLK